MCTMNRLVSLLSVCGIAAGMIGCASTTWTGYKDSRVKYSEIDYSYIAQPVFKDAAGKTYQIQTDAALSGINSIPALEKRGVHNIAGGADVVFKVTSGEITHEPGGFGLSNSYKPAIFSTMPYKIEVYDKEGSQVLECENKHEEILTIDGAKEYKSQEEAKTAMTVITQIARSSADAKVRSGAPATINKDLSKLSKDLFVPRKVSVALPAMRSSGTVDMEAAYKLLAASKTDEQVKAALEAYVALGAEHKKTDGTDDVVGNYGVLCGLASAKIKSGDLAGAWVDTKTAWKMLPEGNEYKLIAKAIHQQEQQTGTTVTQQDEYKEIVKENPKAALSTSQEMMRDFMNKKP